MGTACGPSLFVFGGNISPAACVLNNGMKAKKLLMVAAAAAILAAGLTGTKLLAADNSAPPAAAPVRGQILQHIAQRLNLTDDQKSQIKDIIAG